jgi:C-terminal processing protease CtpA/Prc
VVGERTYGKSGIQLPLLLPGGTIVLVVIAEHGDLAGSIYTGYGIRPDVSVEDPIRGGDEVGDRAVDRAREILEKRKGGS